MSVSETTGSFRGRATDKSNFAQTCSLLSQYLKGKNNFGDLSFGIIRNSEPKGNSETNTTATATATMNLLPSLETSGNTIMPHRVSSMDLFPKGPGVTEGVLFPVTEPEPAQMTIFYAGQILVLDKLPVEKAKEVMVLASKATASSTPNSFAWTSGNDNKLPAGLVPWTSNFISAASQEHPQLPPRPPHVSDLPIARKASLHRFLEKRKDRLSAKAPYELNNTAVSAETKQAESKKTWLGLSSETTKEFNFQS